MPGSDWPEWKLASVLVGRPTVRINQLGHLPLGPKRATWVTDESRPVEFRVIAANGSVTVHGRTHPWPERPDPTSGQSVHVLDFTRLTAAGTGYQVLVGDARSHRFRIAEDLYDSLAHDT